jgi:hypothetical protein
MVLRLRATGPAARPPDTAEVRRALALLADPTAGLQLHAGGGAWAFRTFAGGDLDGMAAWVAENGDTATGVYYNLNPVPAGLPREVTNGDVTYRRWLLVDVDRFKTNETKKLSATDGEHEAAQSLSADVRAWLADFGWPEPVVIDSGNGWHLLYRLDLPNDDLGRALVRAVLKAAADRWDGDRGSVGKECHDARRIAKLPGTWARKGPDTDDRPHRLARLVLVPEVVAVVTPDLLQRAGGTTPRAATPQPNSPSPVTPFSLRAGGGMAKAYARAALRAECAKMARTAPGGLNDQLFRSGAALGNFVGAGLLDDAQVRRELAAAAKGAGCDDPRKDADTLNRAVDVGKAEPRTVPSKNGAHQKADKAQAATEPPPTLTICAAAVAPKRVEWLWPQRVPKRFITVLAGRTGLGKSFVTLDMIARVTTAGDIPFGDGECFQAGGALIVSEDPPEYMLVPRLIEMGADLNRVRFMTWEAMAHYQLADVGYLDRAVSEVADCRVVMIDPPTNFLGEVDEHKNAEVRQLLMNLVMWAAHRDLACVLIMHVNKSTGKGIEAVNRVMGSVAWVSTARIAHTFARRPGRDRVGCRGGHVGGRRDEPGAETQAGRGRVAMARQGLRERDRGHPVEDHLSADGEGNDDQQQRHPRGQGPNGHRRHRPVRPGRRQAMGLELAGRGPSTVVCEEQPGRVRYPGFLSGRISWIPWIS